MQIYNPERELIFWHKGGVGCRGGVLNSPGTSSFRTCVHNTTGRRRIVGWSCRAARGWGWARGGVSRRGGSAGRCRAPPAPRTDGPANTTTHHTTLIHHVSPCDTTQKPSCEIRKCCFGKLDMVCN